MENRNGVTGLPPLPSNIIRSLLKAPVPPVHRNPSTRKYIKLLPLGRSESGRKMAHFCLLCRKTISDEEDHELHVNEHLNSSPYSCSECDGKCQSLRSLWEHQRIHKRRGRFACLFCCQRFVFDNDRLSHTITMVCRQKVQILGRQVAAGIECLECKMVCATKGRFYRHTRYHEASVARRCPVCSFDMSRSRAEEIISHVRTKHPWYLWRINPKLRRRSLRNALVPPSHRRSRMLGKEG